MAQSIILLVEPDKSLAQIYLEALIGAGYEVNLTASVRTAIDSADGQSPDLVILEIELTGHNGIEFLHEFRSYNDWQRVPVIINSNVSPGKFGSSQRELNLLGINQYLYKPRTSLGRLISVVDSELAGETADD